MTIAVTHNEARHRFDATVDGHLCVAEYSRQGQVVWMTHTGVPPEVGGRGIAAELVRVALAWVEAQGYTVEPACSYVDVYMRRHPQTARLRAR